MLSGHRRLSCNRRPSGHTILGSVVKMDTEGSVVTEYSVSTEGSMDTEGSVDTEGRFHIEGSVNTEGTVEEKDQWTQ